MSTIIIITKPPKQTDSPRDYDVEVNGDDTTTDVPALLERVAEDLRLAS